MKFVVKCHNFNVSHIDFCNFHVYNQNFSLGEGGGRAVVGWCKYTQNQLCSKSVQKCQNFCRARSFLATRFRKVRAKILHPEVM